MSFMWPVNINPDLQFSIRRLGSDGSTGDIVTDSLYTIKHF